MGLFELTALILIGLFAGLVGGMLGVGGSIVMIPAMTEVLGPDQHKYQAAAMIVNFFVVVPAVYHHRRARAVEGPTVARLIPLAMVSVLVGVGISELPFFAGEGEAYLRMLFGVFLFFVAGWDLHRLFRRRGPQSAVANEARTGPTEGSGERIRDAERSGWLFAAAVAVPTGLIAGTLGVGGGIMAVPLQRRFLRVPIRTAIANSATIIIATSSVGAIAKNYAFMVEHGRSLATFSLAAVLIPTAIIGSLIGSRWTHRVPLELLKTAFFTLLLLAAVRFTYKAVQALPAPEAYLPRTPSGVAVVWEFPGQKGFEISLETPYLFHQLAVARRQLVVRVTHRPVLADFQLTAQHPQESGDSVIVTGLGDGSSITRRGDTPRWLFDAEEVKDLPLHVLNR